MPDQTSHGEPADSADEILVETPEILPVQNGQQPAFGVPLDVSAAADNDEDSHVPPTDNDGETVPS